MEEFLRQYLFHWTPQKAIFIGGHSMAWDARCSGIYTGLGIGLFHLFLTGRRSKYLPPWPILCLCAFMFLPLFIDLVTVRGGLREPSNDIRFLTGILFGGAFIACLYPAFVSFVLTNVRKEAAISSFTRYAAYLLTGISAFLLKQADGMIAFVVLNSFSFIGFGGLAVICIMSMARGIHISLRKR